MPVIDSPRCSSVSTAVVGWVVFMLWVLPYRPLLAEPTSFQRDIQPLLDRYCVACHSCFDAPCQLDLTSVEGLRRGASKLPVYNGKRVERDRPTRLFIDARSESVWREMGFFSVLEPVDGGPGILQRLLAQKYLAGGGAQPLPEAIRPRVGKTHQCPAPEEIDAFIERFPHAGMPLGFPSLPEAESRLLQHWLAAGAPLDSAPVHATASEQAEIDQWERWLNGPSPPQQLVSRWLYEHWYYARLYSRRAGDQAHFFRLVRSSTPPGEPVDELATRRPNDDPGQSFYYRFQLQTATRVYKTHITFALAPDLLNRIQQLFFGEPWQVSQLPGYSAAEQSNPFLTFAAIPAAARYRFMLEHAEYFVRTFIRGPVCRGQVATAVIRDRFWVMFQAPENDPFVAIADYRDQVTPLLDLPGIEDDLLEGAADWFDAAESRNRYLQLRNEAMARLQPQGADLNLVWQGDGRHTDAMLTVFRHHDSATVKAGWLGRYPQTLWLMDFPLLERSYYNLVVNFDVFGNIAHQAQTRLYFDLIRNGSEQNFLRLLPAKQRQQELDGWYEGSGKLKLWLAYQKIDTTSPSAIPYSSAQPKRELLELLLKRMASVNASPDPLNRPAATASDDADINTLSPLAGVEAAQMPAILELPNAALLILRGEAGETRLFTLVRNRQHTNVAFLLGESLRYQPQRDTLTLVEGLATSYPNYIFSLPRSQLAQFVAVLRDPRLATAQRFRERVVNRWGIASQDPQFWSHLESVHRYLQRESPLQAGRLDIYRYSDYSLQSLPLLPKIELFQ